MRVINPDHIQSADYALFGEMPSTATGDDVLHSYVMERGGKFARLDIRSDKEGRFEVMGSLVPERPVEIGVVTWIPIVAAPDKSKAFEQFCEQGPSRVLATEPETLLWFSLKDKSNAGKYAIIDLYRDESGLQAHNVGEVAANLKANSPDLVFGGWKAVVSGASVYAVTAQRSDDRTQAFGTQT
ncbi:MAG: hypothetical protein VXW22_04605 [Pseudomonadota bacterium]|nr:hypothetical protein [Pseudomonadota bacterium]